MTGVDDPGTELRLRAVVADDIAFFYEHQLDPVAARMVAFTRVDRTDREAFLAHWATILAEDTIVKRTILVDGHVAGNVLKFDGYGQPEVGYWLGREWWGRGVATRALGAFLVEVAQRPIHAVVAKDNLASLRVLEKCGFTITGEDRAFSNARGVDVEQYVLTLESRTA